MCSPPSSDGMLAAVKASRRRRGSLRGFLLGHISRDHEFALRSQFCLRDRPLSLDHLMHDAFTETEAASDVGRSHSHLAKPEDLLFVNFCESKNRLKHERRHFA
jgi:hypothetical protein